MRTSLVGQALDDLGAVLQEVGVACRANGEEFRAIYDREFLDTAAGEVVVHAQSPVLQVRTEDLVAAAIAHGSTIEIFADPWTGEPAEYSFTARARSNRPDGTGWSLVLLSLKGIDPNE